MLVAQREKTIKALTGATRGAAGNRHTPVFRTYGAAPLWQRRSNVDKVGTQRRSCLERQTASTAESSTVGPLFQPPIQVHFNVLY